MDLLACSVCQRRFYVAGTNSHEDIWCPHCGGSLKPALHHISSIPLDARWLDGRPVAEGSKLTVVDLRRKPGNRRKASKRIVKELRGYFDVYTAGRLTKVNVNRGEPESAALRVAAVLDGVDSSWEEHFHLPTTEADTPTPSRAPTPLRHLRLVAEADGEQGPVG